MCRSTVLLTLVLATMATGSAHAATVSSSTGNLTVSGGGEDNTIIIDRTGSSWRVVENGATALTASSGCSGSATVVTCLAPGPGSIAVTDTGGTNAYYNQTAFTSTMAGGSGPDRLDGGTGSDLLTGNGGADALNGGGGVDILRGGTGGDTFTGGGNPGDFATVTYDTAMTAVTVTIGDGPNDGGSLEGDDVTASINQVIGSPAADTITSGGTAPHTLRGGDGADHLSASTTAGAAGDRLIGEAGDDVLTGGTGFDAIAYDYVGSTPATPGVTATLAGASPGGGFGAGDQDTYQGSIELLRGSVRGDHLTGSAGDDHLMGAGGDDVIDAGSGDDHVWGDSDAPTFTPPSDADDLTGGAGDDVLFGDEGNDVLHLDDGARDHLDATASDCDGPSPPNNGLPSTADAVVEDAADAAVGCETVTDVDGTSAAPTVTLTEPADGAFPGDQPRFRGTAGGAAAGASIHIELLRLIAPGSTTTMGSDVGFDVTAAGGAFDATYAGSLSEGSYRVRAVYHPGQGDQVLSASRTFFVDTTAPTVRVTSPVAGAILTDRRPVVEGFAADGPADGQDVTVEFRQSDVLQSSVTVRRTGTHWTASPSLDLGLGGTFTVKAFQTDANGRRGESSAITFRVVLAPAVRTPPAVVGTGRVGQTLTVRQGTYDGTQPFRFEHYWVSCDGAGGNCVPESAPRDARPLTAADIGHTLLVVEKVTGLGGFSTLASSAKTAPVADVVSTAGITVQGIEVSQGTQRAGVPAAFSTSTEAPAIPFSHPAAAYKGVRLADGGLTVARVFVTITRKATLRLYGFRNGSALPGGPLTPTNTRDPELGGTTASDKQTHDAGGFAFTLPDSWASGTIKLVAVAVPSTVATAATCEDCGPGNAFALAGIAFEKVRPFTVALVRMDDGRKAPASIQTPFERGLQLVPQSDGGLSFPLTYSGVIDTSGSFGAKLNRSEVGSAGLTLLKTWDNANQTAGDYVVGVTQDKREILVTDGVEKVFNPRTCVRKVCTTHHPMSVLTAGERRPFTGIDHEMFHAFGLSHASAACGGGTGGQVGVPWPPDEKGYLHGVGVDRFTVVNGAPAILDGSASSFYDLMSYCATAGNGDPDAWIGPDNWDAAFATLSGEAAGGRAVVAPVARAAAMDGAALTVTATVDADGTATVQDVQPSGSPPAGRPTAVRFVARDAAGAVLADVAGVGGLRHEDQGAVSIVAAAAVPATAQSIDLTSAAGQVLATRRRSAHAPEIAITAPRAGAVVGRGKDVTVTWRSSDADGDVPIATVEYSLDGGRTFKALYVGQDKHAATLPSGLLAASRSARVRVTLDDGFNRTAATSAAFRAQGRPPLLAVDAPDSGETVRSDAVVGLRGHAQDDAGRALTGKALRWTLGRTLLGTGPRIPAAGLAPGKRRITLTARDRTGRTARSAVTLRVRAVAPGFLALKAPAKLSRKAKLVRLRVQVTEPSVLKAGGRSYRLGLRAATVAVPVTPGAKALTLALRLTAYGKASAVAVAVAR